MEKNKWNAEMTEMKLCIGGVHQRIKASSLVRAVAANAQPVRGREKGWGER